MEDNNDVIYDLTGKKIIPLNAPIGFANETPPTTLPFQAAERKQSVSEGLCAGQGVPYYNEDGTINVNAVATTLKMMLDMYNTISQPVALLSMGAVPEWSQSVIDNNGGYPKDFVVREYDSTGCFVYYQSNVDNNINPKPTLASHVGWCIINTYKIDINNNCYLDLYGNLYDTTPKLEYSHDGITCFDKPDYTQYSVLTYQHLEFYKKLNGVTTLVANYSFDESSTPVSFANKFQDIHMQYPIGNIIKQDTSQHMFRMLTLSNGTVLALGDSMINPNIDDQYQAFGISINGGAITFKEPPFVLVSLKGIWGDFVFYPNMAPAYEVGAITTQGFKITNVNPNHGLTYSWIAIGTLANYVGDILAKIRAYNVTPYYKKLSKNQKQELDQYYIALDETKDLTKVTAPEWLEAELDGKELA